MTESKTKPLREVRSPDSKPRSGAMPMEQSGRRSVDQFKLKPQACVDGPFKGYYKLDWINSVAMRDPARVFDNIIHHVNEDNLIQAFRGLDGSKAVGIDHVTKREYGQNLRVNIEVLTDEIRRGGWRPRPSREVLIPKPSGGKRPLAIGCLEDKIVQALVAKILEAIYEPRFHRHSYGFRTGRSAHQALGRVYSAINKRGKHTVVVEMDVEKFFNHVDHDKLMEFLKRKISDQFFLRLVRRMLRNSILSEDGTLIDNTTGTPQGSPVSPILANIYLHYVLDEWFDENYISKGAMVRYADDAVFVFDDLKVAERFKARLTARFVEYGLKLNDDKSGIVEFGPKNKGAIGFVGFILYWGKARTTKTILRLKTAPERYKRALQNFKEWIKSVRNRFPTRELWKRIAARLRGHYNYYAVSLNDRWVSKFYLECVRLVFRWLNRRSQKISYTWRQFARKLMFNPLPRAPRAFELIDITTEYGSEKKHKTKSRMRKSRTSGSARSSGRQRPLFT
jgi:RNA-directed DNA polymerase